MNKKREKFEKMGAIALSSLLTIQTTKVNAQIIPDNSLNTAASCNSGICNITGGKIAGNNLFHSFNNFSIPSFGEASFNNPSNITNIINRVTGANISNIDGKISANGSANVFLINPNGIIFGRNASLKIGGSFVATTASIMQFGTAGNFGVNTGNDVSLLTVNPSALLINQIQAQGITNKANLQVNPGQNLVLVGNNLTVDGGSLFAPGGGVELASISNGTVELNFNDFSLTVSNNAIRGDISIFNNSTIDISGNGGSAINLQGNNITIDNGSKVTSNNLGNLKGGDININSSNLKITNKGYISTSTFAQGNAGNLTITSDNIDILGSRDFTDILLKLFTNTFDATQFQDGLFALSFGTGKAGNININTRTLTAKDGAIIFTAAFGQGLGGNLTLNFEEFTNFNNAGMITGTASKTGNAGDLIVMSEMGKILLEKGAVFATPSLNDGNSGNLIIQAKELEITGRSSNKIFLPSPFIPLADYIRSTLSAESYGNGNAGYIQISTINLIMNGAAISTANGINIEGIKTTSEKSGNINVNTDNLSMNNDSYIHTSSYNNSGDLTTNTNKLIMMNGAQITTISYNNNSGDLTINTNKLIMINGAQIQSFSLGKQQGGNIKINANNSVEITGHRMGLTEESPSGIFAGANRLLNTSTDELGNVGNLEINTPLLIVSDTGIISVSNGFQSSAGNLNIKANMIILNNGSLDAKTNANKSIGNINVDSVVLLMMNNGQITTNGVNATGGNININSDILAAIKDNNTITANALSNFGGRVIINAQSIFGSQFINITASSGLGLEFNGTVTINTPGIDPNNGLVPLSENLTDITKQIQEGCIADKGNKFNIAGRGGLPPNPQEGLRTESTQISDSNQNKLVEATNFKVNNQGKIVLIADTNSSSINDLDALKSTCNPR